MWCVYVSKAYKTPLREFPLDMIMCEGDEATCKAYVLSAMEFVGKYGAEFSIGRIS